MTDYQCHPLWEASPGEVGNVDPGSLAISASLLDQITHWAGVYDKTLNWENPAMSGFESADLVDSFKAQGMKLADQLRDELGPAFGIVTNINAFVKADKT